MVTLIIFIVNLRYFFNLIIICSKNIELSILFTTYHSSNTSIKKGLSIKVTCRDFICKSSIVRTIKKAAFHKPIITWPIYTTLKLLCHYSKLLKYTMNYIILLIKCKQRIDYFITIFSIILVKVHKYNLLGPIKTLLFTQRLNSLNNIILYPFQNFHTVYRYFT